MAEHPLDVTRFGPREWITCPEDGCGARALGISGMAAHLVVIHDPDYWQRVLTRAQGLVSA